MKHTTKKLLSIFLAVLILTGTLVLPTEVSASGGLWIEAVKEAPIWSEPTKYSTKIKTVPKGTVCEVTDSTVNSYGHTWYLTADGWVYSENVKPHTHKAVMCGKPEISYSSIDEAAHFVHTTYFDLCSCGFKLTQSHSEATEAHNFTNGDAVCIDCGYAFSRVYETCDALVKLSEDCYTYNGPTKYAVKTGRQLLKGETYKVKERVTKNEFLNEWYVLEDDGSYFFSGHVDHVHSGSMCGMPDTTYTQYNDTEHYKSTYNGDNLCHCGYKISDGTTYTVTESHNYVQGVCSDCGFIFNRVFTENNVWVRLKEDCYSYSAPSKDGDKVYYYLANEDAFTVGTIVNEHNHTWYKLLDGTFIYDVHIDHTHSAVMCGNASKEYQQYSESTHITYLNNGGELCSCGFQVAESTVTQTEEAHSFGGLSFCSECGYHKEIAEPSPEEEAPEASEGPEETQNSGTSKAPTENNHSENYIKDTDEEKAEDKKTTASEKVTSNSDAGRYTCDDYEDCTSDGADIYVIAEDNCPIRKSPGLFGEVVTRAKKGQLVSVKKVSWHLLALSRWAELNVSDSDEKYYIHIGNLQLHDTHTFVNALTTSKGTVDFCSVCGIGKATLGGQTTTCDLTCILEQTIMGSFSTKEANFISIIAQIIVGEIPYLGSVADARDLIGDVLNGKSILEVGIDAFAVFVPLVGMFKYTDEVLLITKNADELAAVSGKAAPDLSRKLEYVFGNASGTRKNIERSKEMEATLNSIGIYDNDMGRILVKQNIVDSYYETGNSIIQENGRLSKDSLLIGPNGIAKMNTVWENERLITVELFKTKWESHFGDIPYGS